MANTVIHTNTRHAAWHMVAGIEEFEQGEIAHVGNSSAFEDIVIKTGITISKAPSADGDPFSASVSISGITTRSTKLGDGEQEDQVTYSGAWLNSVSVDVDEKTKEAVINLRVAMRGDVVVHGVSFSCQIPQ